MPHLEYSSDALNILNKFYQSNILIYVEGDDDIPFWRSVFSFSDHKLSFESTGGSEELDRIISRIQTDGVRLIAARDLDYLKINKSIIESERVVYSVGYSIENSLYTKCSIRKIAELAHRKLAPTPELVEQWMENFCNLIYPVAINDIASAVDGIGAIALSDSCESFMKSNKSSEACPTKIFDRLKQIERKIPESSREKALNLIAESGGYSEVCLRGHFLASAVLRFVRSYSERDVAKETLFTTALSIFDNEIRRNHPHRDHYQSNARRAIDSVMQP